MKKSGEKPSIKQYIPLRSIKTAGCTRRSLRDRLNFKDELLLALLPTATILVVLAFVESLSEQRVLFSTLAASAFLIYLDPQHNTNSVKTLFFAQMIAAITGLGTFLLLGPGFWAGGIAMITTIALIILLDIVHPPAVSTSLLFSFKAEDENNLLLFGLAVVVTALLVFLEWMTLLILAKTGKSSE